MDKQVIYCRFRARALQQLIDCGNSKITLQINKYQLQIFRIEIFVLCAKDDYIVLLQ